MKKRLTKTSYFSAGVDYHLYSASSAVGNKVTQRQVFYDSSARTLASVNDYYTIGNSGRYSNKYQLAELPVNLYLNLNKNQQKPLLLSAGISPGYLFASNALYANPSSNVYYADKQKFQHFQLFAQSALLFPVAGSPKCLLNIGPVVQYSFTNTAKAVAGARQHLFFTGIKANIIFK